MEIWHRQFGTDVALRQSAEYEQDVNFGLCHK